MKKDSTSIAKHLIASHYEICPDPSVDNNATKAWYYQTGLQPGEKCSPNKVRFSEWGLNLKKTFFFVSKEIAPSFLTSVILFLFLLDGELIAPFLILGKQYGSIPLLIAIVTVPFLLFWLKKAPSRFVPYVFLFLSITGIMATILISPNFFFFTMTTFPVSFGIATIIAEGTDALSKKYEFRLWHIFLLLPLFLPSIAMAAFFEIPTTPEMITALLFLSLFQVIAALFFIDMQGANLYPANNIFLGVFFASASLSIAMFVFIPFIYFGIWAKGVKNIKCSLKKLEDPLI